MFDIGFLELLIIGVVGLLVLGPERLPKAARTLGLWVGKIKRTVSGMQREISAQLEAEELRQKLAEQQQKLDQSLERARRDIESIAEDRPRDRPAASAPPREETPASPEQRLDAALEQTREKAADGADARDSADTRDSIDTRNSIDTHKDASSR